MVVLGDAFTTWVICQQTHPSRQLDEFTLLSLFQTPLSSSFFIILLLARVILHHGSFFHTIFPHLVPVPTLYIPDVHAAGSGISRPPHHPCTNLVLRAYTLHGCFAEQLPTAPPPPRRQKRREEREREETERERGSTKSEKKDESRRNKPRTREGMFG